MKNGLLELAEKISRLFFCSHYPEKSISWKEKERLEDYENQQYSSGRKEIQRRENEDYQTSDNEQLKSQRQTFQEKSCHEKDTERIFFQPEEKRA